MAAQTDVLAKPLLFVKRRSHRFGGEVLIPQPRGEFGHARRRLLADALEHVDEVVVRIDLVQPAGGDQASHHADVFGADLGSTEEPRFPVMSSYSRSGFDWNFRTSARRPRCRINRRRPKYGGRCRVVGIFRVSNFALTPRSFRANRRRRPNPGARSGLSERRRLSNARSDPGLADPPGLSKLLVHSD